MAPIVAMEYTSKQRMDLPPKKDVARALLLRGSVFVYLDPRVADVVLPPWLKKQPQVVLEIGLDMPIPIPDLRVDQAGIFGTLSFQRSPFACSVPWEAVFALSGEDGRPVLWPESMPPEIAAEVQREVARRKRGDDRPAAPEASPEENVRRMPPGRHLRPAREPSPALATSDANVEARPSEAETTATSSPKEQKTKKGRELPPYLRVIK